MNPLDFDNVENRHLAKILQLHADSTGDTVFLMEGDRHVTFADANAQVNRIARGLADLGVRRNDRVAFLMKSAIEVVYIALAANKLGAIWVPINTDYKGIWLAETLAESKAQVIVTDGALLPRLLQVIDQVPHGHLVVFDAVDLPDGARPFTSLFAYSSDAHDLDAFSYGDVSAVLWTSGTTGKSKGVMQSHNVWVRTALSGTRAYATEAGDSILNVLPLYNSASWSANILRALVSGIPCALEPAFSVTNFWDRARYYGSTQTFTLGAMHMFLWQASAKPDDHLQPIHVASMVPMPSAIKEPFCTRFNIRIIGQGFGQSEILGCTTQNGSPGRMWKPDSVGIAMSDLEVRLLDNDGKEVPVGEVAEFAVRPKSPHIMFESYFNNPEATADAFTEDGFYRLGDLGRVDEDGEYFFVDRKKDAVRYKGRNISTLEVETAVRAHPDVVSVAAFGIQSKELETEDEIKINVILKPDCDLREEDLARFINEHAPYYFVPRYIEFVDALPYTPTNKVQKYLLREAGVSEGIWDRDAAAFEWTR